MTLLGSARRVYTLARAVARGTLSYVPPIDLLLTKARAGGGTESPEYCYSIWLRHLVLAHKHGLPTTLTTVAELGPGSSVGVGLAALLTGSERYWALDVLNYANVQRNIEIFEGLIDLLQTHAAIPHGRGFAEIQPPLDSYEFPAAVLTKERLASALSLDRVQRLRRATLELGAHEPPDNSPLSYMASWGDAAQIRRETVDAIVSQAVMEHVDDLPATYRAIHAWLKPGGFMSHQIDFRSHRLTQEWNGHWGVSDFQWRLMRGKRAYFLNREPYSSHRKLISEHGFTIVDEHRLVEPTGIRRSALAPRFRHLSDDDLTTSGLFVQAVKNPSASNHS